MTTPLLDQRARPLRQLRVSVTDRCNLRCEYCMPELDYVWLPRPQILSLEEVQQVVQVFVELGVEGVRLTGGEPLLRRDLDALVRSLAETSGIRDLAMTTNAVLLADQAAALRAAGLQRLTVSLDTLDAARFAQLTRRDRFAEVMAGLQAAEEVGFRGTKINTVVQRGFNDDELVALLGFARERKLEIRFIEYMDVGGATHWQASRVVSKVEILHTLEQAFGSIREVPRRDAAPADRFELEDGTRFGIIASTTAPFCSSCDRSRLTADGTWFRCLYARHGDSLRDLLRDEGMEAVRARVMEAWQARADAGAEERLALQERRGPLQEPGRPAGDDPLLEMRSRGG